MLDIVQFLFYVILLSFLYYTYAVRISNANYYDIDIVNEMLTSYAAGGGADASFSPFYDLVFETTDRRKHAELYIEHLHFLNAGQLRWIAFGFISYRFLPTDKKYKIELSLNGNLVIIEVSHDNKVWASDPSLIKDMRTVLRENFSYAFFISMFSQILKKKPNQLIDKTPYYEDMHKLKMRGIEQVSYHVENEIDLGLPHMQVKQHVDDPDAGIAGIIYTIDVFIGGYHFRIFTDIEADTFYVDEIRVSKRKFIKLFDKGVKQWAMRNKTNKQRLLTLQ